MRILVTAWMLVLFCGCGRQAHPFDRDAHVQKKVYSILPQLDDEMTNEGMEHVFGPELLNPWVESLDTNRVVARLQIGLIEMPQNRRAILWMLKAYAPEKTWRHVSAEYPALAADLPSVSGYGVHP